MITIEHSNSRIPERQYIFKVIFEDILGTEWKAVVNNSLEQETILYTTSAENSISIPDKLFSIPDQDWLHKNSMPLEPLEKIYLKKYQLSTHNNLEKIPVVYGNLKSSKYDFPIDIFGSCFFLITRYEENVTPAFDKHNRFPSSASLACREHFLERPLVNEYAYLLWQMLMKLNSGINQKKSKYRFYVSCDVDVPFDDSLWKKKFLFRKVAGDLLKRRSSVSAIQSIKKYLNAQQEGIIADPFNTFDWMMDQNEKNNVILSCYFITNHSSNLDGTYHVSEKRIQSLMKTIHARGHNLGLHGSYNSYNNASILMKEAKILFSLCDNLKISQNKWGGRQHVLRYDNNNTLINWEKAGFDYDSTLGYADHIGFRTSCCSPHSTFSLMERRNIGIKERPLMAMEQTLAAQRYMGLGFSVDFFDRIISIFKTVKYYGGEFSLLWHNSNFTLPNSKEIYSQILAECS
ncbi:MAG: polysaccharide deacetylase family protein [Ignavibacteriae bacterium]|nr:polysaccharide deacetylase family protein [Ignavibacteriota bacterium]